MNVNDAAHTETWQKICDLHVMQRTDWDSATFDQGNE